MCFGLWTIFLKDNQKQVTHDNQDAKTTSTLPTAQEDFTGGDERQPGNTVRENEGTGNIEDRQGAVSEQTDPGVWTTSSTGEVTVQNPYPNKILRSGTEISGTSSLQKVSYRIIDSVSGVIAQGELTVVNGKFSGIINFSSSATEGRLDIFGAHSDGSEFSNVEIPIKI